MSAFRRALSAWQHDPYRVFFPLGAVLLWWGVSHWFLFGLGKAVLYRSIFHALTQSEGFFTCFALGFLFTFLPRRTQAPPPKVAELVVSALCPVGVVTCAWFELWAPSQLFWLVLSGVVFAFSVRCLRRPGAWQRLGSSFVWVPAAWAIGLIGSVITGIGAYFGDPWMWVHDVGRRMVVQGLPTGLVLGVGGTLLPQLFWGKPPTPGEGPSARRAKGLHLGLAGVLLASFWLEALWGVSVAHGVRAALALAIILGFGGWKPPSVAAFNRQLMWVALWALPVGNAVVSALPTYRRAGIHIVFIGCFALLLFAVSSHIALSHAGRGAALSGRPWQLVVMAALFVPALVVRQLVEYDPENFYIWVSTAAALFLAGSLGWVALVVPALWQVPKTS